MQTLEQTVLSAQTIKFEIRGTYFTILGTNLGLNVRFYKNGKKSDLGDIKNLLAGLEVKFDGDDYFDRVEIDTLGADTIQVGIGNGQARYNRSQGNVSITNLQLDNGRIQVAPIAYTGSYASNALSPVLTAEVIVSPAANVNGLLIWNATFLSANATAFGKPAMVAKNAVPASAIDGDVILPTSDFNTPTGLFVSKGNLVTPIKIPAGKGLYFFSGGQAETNAARSVLYTLL